MLLDGVKILEFSRVIAAPMASMMLGDLGASVIKVELPSGDDSRYLGVEVNGDHTLFHSVNRNKKSAVLDLNKANDRQTFNHLIRWADVFITNFRPDVIAKMHITYDELIKENPQLIYCLITGFGETGLYSNRPGLDIVFQSMSGLMSITGEEEGSPVRAGTPIVDAGGGITAALGIASALYNREKTGNGSKLSISLLDVGVFLQSPMYTQYFATGEPPERLGNASAFAFATDIKTRDSPIVISIPNDKFWRKLCKALEMEELIVDDRFNRNEGRLKHRKELQKVLTDIFKNQTSAYWIEKLQNEGIPASKIYSYTDVFNDPQIQSNSLFVKTHHKKWKDFYSITTPISINGKYAQSFEPSPDLGEHQIEIEDMVKE